MNTIDEVGASLLLGNAPAIRKLRDDLHEIALSDAAVVIYGETGTGKELVAQYLHQLSDRRHGMFVPINCGGIPEPLFESELFGHEQGAFTGASRVRVGLIEHARGGTLFFDEIESMPLGLQVKILRVLQEGELRRLGDNSIRDIDVRIVASSKADLLQASNEGRFRPDLYYRLNVAEIHLPPLRDRREDIIPLFEHFCALRAQSSAREPIPFTPDNVHVLMTHSWPGNIRELRNVAQGFALGLSGSPGTVLGRLNASSRAGGRISETMADIEPAARPRTLKELVNDFEKHVIVQCLKRHRGNVSAVLEDLDLPRRTLNDKMRRYQIRLKDFRRRN